MSGHSKWANIKHRKERADAKKGKVFTKLGRELIVAAKQGGSDPETNSRLKMAVQRAREANMPNDTIARAIQRGSGSTEGENFEEVVYEGYGPGGVAVLLQILTDNRNRTASEIRYLFSRNGGNLGESGCVAWMFGSKGVFTVDLLEGKSDTEETMLLAIEAGAEDVNLEEGRLEIVVPPENLEEIKTVLTKAGVAVSGAEVTLVPQTIITINEPEQARKMIKLLDLLEDHDDVQAVYANCEIPEEIVKEAGV